MISVPDLERERISSLTQTQVAAEIAAWKATMGQYPPESWAFHGPLILMLDRKVTLQARAGARRHNAQIGSLSLEYR